MDYEQVRMIHCYINKGQFKLTLMAAGVASEGPHQLINVGSFKKTSKTYQRILSPKILYHLKELLNLDALLICTGLLTAKACAERARQM